MADDMKMPMNGKELSGDRCAFFQKRGVCGALGDPSKDGLYVVRLKMPAGLQIRPTITRTKP